MRTVEAVSRAALGRVFLFEILKAAKGAYGKALLAYEPAYHIGIVAVLCKNQGRADIGISPVAAAIGMRVVIITDILRHFNAYDISD